MIRVLIYVVVLAGLAYAGMLVVQNPGHVTLTWHDEVVNAPAALLIGAIAIAAIVIWGLLRFILGLPSVVSFMARQRRREKGYAALSRGLVAVGAGDARAAARASSQANRHLKDDPLAIMLRAEAAHLSGDGLGARAAFEALAQRDDTRILGLRGLHAEASRRGDDEAARHFAAAAHRDSPLPWSAEAVLSHRASVGEWEKALMTVETSLSAKLIDKETGERQRAVLETAIAYEKEMIAPDTALAMARSALKRAPDLAPAAVIAARLLTRRGDIRKASRLIEKAWPQCQHPDLATAYLDVRPGDSTSDRLTRAKTLMGIASYEPVSRLTVGRAALAGKDFATARNAMAPLVGEGTRPTVRMCTLMAEIEEAEHGDLGHWREWLARASHASLDPAWVSDGTVYDRWAPTSPTTGKLDTFRWQVPAERLGPAMDAMPAPLRPTLSSPPSLPPEPVMVQEAADPPAEPKPAPVEGPVSSPEPTAEEPHAISPPVTEKEHAIVDTPEAIEAGAAPPALEAGTPELVALPAPKPPARSFMRSSR